MQKSRKIGRRRECLMLLSQRMHAAGSRHAVRGSPQPAFCVVTHGRTWRCSLVQKLMASGGSRSQRHSAPAPSNMTATTPAQARAIIVQRAIPSGPWVTVIPRVLSQLVAPSLVKV